MSESFFSTPILNNPYHYPDRHWELDEDGQPTGNVLHRRRPADFITPIPKPRRRGAAEQRELGIDIDERADDSGQQYRQVAEVVGAVRAAVDAWRTLPNPADWKVTPETQRLLQHWRHHDFAARRPFFCQVEAVEALIWVSEVAPKGGAGARKILDALSDANEANPGLSRIALKLATGAGKTTVMAMLVAWQTVNAVRRPGSRNFTKGFLVVAPGVTIRDRLRVLLPNDPDSYYRELELVPPDLLPALEQARVVITNYHAFKRKENLGLSKGNRRLLEGRDGEVDSTETDGEMLKRVMPQLMSFRQIMVLNDEAHHCYQEKPAEENEEAKLAGDELAESKQNTEAARLWINGLETVRRRLGVQRVVDLSATPFFLAGSGYREGTLFPWTVTDFSLMDAIECGIVKLPRVPVADNTVTGQDRLPVYRELWKHIRDDMPRKGRGGNQNLSPEDLPKTLLAALDALYGHYVRTFELWEKAGRDVPPCFIVVCNNTAASKLIHDYISGYEIEYEDGSTEPRPGRLELFRNTDEHGNPEPRMRTLLIDSYQLESGGALDADFRKLAAPEIERFRDEIIERTGDRKAADNLDDATLLREVMNTVGKPGRLGERIRCVVSVSMLTEGWDANNVTHVLGVRAFGTQLLCEQVIGRALRRQIYELNDQGLFDAEYADVLGIPFDFAAQAVVAPPQPPVDRVTVRAVRPERDDLEIVFPRVEGYRVEMPTERLEATFDDDSTLTLTPDLVGPTVTRNAGIVGDVADLTPHHLDDYRYLTIVSTLTNELIKKNYRDVDGAPRYGLYGKLKPIVRRWFDHHLECQGDTRPAQVLYAEIAQVAIERITAGITQHYVESGDQPILAVVAPYADTGSTRHVSFTTSKTPRWDTCGPPPKSHLNWHVCDSEWEVEFCRAVENHPRVLAYVKNRSLGFEVPYRLGGTPRRYLPDFILRVHDGVDLDAPCDDPLHLVVEVKGYRGEDAKTKKQTMESYWVPGVNGLRAYGRWGFAELTDVYAMNEKLGAELEAAVAEMVDARLNAPVGPR